MKSFAWLMCGALLLGCGGRPSAWDKSFTPASGNSGVSAAYGLTGSVAVIDQGLGRATMLRSPSALNLSAESFDLGRDLANAQVSPDRQSLFLLSRGVQPQRNPGDEPPKLMIIDGGVNPSVKQTYTLDEALDQLAIDPDNQWAVVYGGSGLVVNENELLFVDLTKPSSDPTAVAPKTLRSFGQSPDRLTFTEPLAIPGSGSHRLLIVERDQDIALVDLVNPTGDEVTVPLPSADNGSMGSSAQVAYGQDDTAGVFIGVRVTGSSSVFLLQLGTPEKGEAFSVVTNEVDVGGFPSTIDFVRTSQGLRLIALVGTNAVLVDPVTAISATATMPAPFTGIRRITAALDPQAVTTDTDIALLYGSNTTQIAYFTLGGAPGALYRSIEASDIGVAVQDVIDVPGDEFHDRKILETPSQEFFVLDLTTRQTAPMRTTTGLTLDVSPDGERVWAYQPGSPGFATVDFAKLHPVSLVAERDVNSVFEINAANGAQNAIALHFGSGYQGGIGATVVDVSNPSTATARFFSGFEFGGI
ncbi:MAG TPA: hypothetical protein VHV51_19375 [Polyangiaceae bacterium]|jgi:hypothetical protein|nr:hypothetical protein [Polyangiaceae bacterium]